MTESHNKSIDPDKYDIILSFLENREKILENTDTKERKKSCRRVLNLAEGSIL